MYSEPRHTDIGEAMAHNRRVEQAREAEQKKFIGNAVEVNMSRVLCEALARELMDKAA